MGTRRITGPVDPGPDDPAMAMRALVFPVAWLPELVGPDHPGVEL
ncbi:MAG: hypothetical protein ACYCV5_08760 [Acidimicrobiales bacterium]